MSQIQCDEDLLLTQDIVVVFAFHLMPNHWFAEFEFCTGAVKVTTMAIVLLTCVAIAAGAGPTGRTDWGANYNELPAFPNGFRVSQAFLYLTSSYSHH